MKKLFFLAAAAVAAFSISSCSSDCKEGKCDKKDGRDQVYTGVMPGADVDGIRYTLLLDYDHDGKDGDYTLVETYIKADTLSPFGYKDVATFASEGDFTVNTQGDKTYLKLVKDAKDSANAGVPELYLLVDSDSALTVTNPTLDVTSTPEMNYTLTRGQF